jgi:hypothetical protein
MQIVNVIEVVDGIVFGCNSYVITSRLHESDIIIKAEEDFLAKARVNSSKPIDEDYLLEEGTFEEGNYSVVLTWSDLIF